MAAPQTNTGSCSSVLEGKDTQSCIQKIIHTNMHTKDNTYKHCTNTDTQSIHPQVVKLQQYLFPTFSTASIQSNFITVSKHTWTYCTIYFHLKNLLPPILLPYCMYISLSSTLWYTSNVLHTYLRVHKELKTKLDSWNANVLFSNITTVSLGTGTTTFGRTCNRYTV